MGFYEKGTVRIHFEEAGSGFPLLVIRRRRTELDDLDLSGSSSPFNPMEEFKAEYHCIAPTCATPRAASPPARSKPTVPGTPTPTTTSA